MRNHVQTDKSWNKWIKKTIEQSIEFTSTFWSIPSFRWVPPSILRFLFLKTRSSFSAAIEEWKSSTALCKSVRGMKGITLNQYPTVREKYICININNSIALIRLRNCRITLFSFYQVTPILPVFSVCSFREYNYYYYNINFFPLQFRK